MASKEQHQQQKKQQKPPTTNHRPPPTSSKSSSLSSSTAAREALSRRIRKKTRDRTTKTTTSKSTVNGDSGDDGSSIGQRRIEQPPTVTSTTTTLSQQQLLEPTPSSNDKNDEFITTTVSSDTTTITKSLAETMTTTTTETTANSSNPETITAAAAAATSTSHHTQQPQQQKSHPKPPLRHRPVVSFAPTTTKTVNPLPPSQHHPPATPLPTTSLYSHLDPHLSSPINDADNLPPPRSLSYTPAPPSRPPTNTTTATPRPLSPTSRNIANLLNSIPRKVEFSAVATADRRKQQQQQRTSMSSSVKSRSYNYATTPSQPPRPAPSTQLKNVNVAPPSSSTSHHPSSPTPSSSSSSPSSIITNLDATYLRYTTPLTLQTSSALALSATLHQHKYHATTTTSSSAATRLHLVNLSSNDDMLRYGDIIAIQSPLANNAVFGYRDGDDEGRISLGFFRMLVGRKERWRLEGGVDGEGIRAGRSVILRPEVGEGVLGVTREGELAFRRQRRLMTAFEEEDGVEVTWRLMGVDVPPCPDWVYNDDERVYLKGRYLRDDERGVVGEEERQVLFDNVRVVPREEEGSLEGRSVEEVEGLMMEDVLYCMMGLEGRYVKAKVVEGGDVEEAQPPSHITFTILPPHSNHLPPHLHSLLSPLLVLGSHYTLINEFVQSRLTIYEYGLVAQALAAAIDELLNDYLTLICQLRDSWSNAGSNLTMAQLHCLIQPSLRTMSILSSLIPLITSTRGGALLNALSRYTSLHYAGDEMAMTLSRHLLRAAAGPYVTMANKWLKEGVLHDAYEEFMIGEGGEGEGWEEWFTLREEYVIDCWRGVGEVILTTGKYLNVLKTCRATAAAAENDVTHDDHNTHALPQSSPSSSSSPLRYEMTSRQISTAIQHSFNLASSSLLDLIIRQHELPLRLRAMKRYFLLDQGDFFVQFLDMAEDELLQELPKVRRGRVRSLLAVALQTTAGGGSKDATGDLKNDLRCDFATHGVVDHLATTYRDENDDNDPSSGRTPRRVVYGKSNVGLMGIEAFMLDYRVSYPLNLILTKKVMGTYQLIFRHLFFSKHVERRLFATWLDHQSLKELDLQPEILGPTYLLRRRMLHFLQNFVYYMMFEVVEPHWNDMERQMRSCKTLDDVVRVHDFFLESTEREFLLANRELLKILTKVMNTCLLFSDQMKRFMDKTKIDEEFDKIATHERHKRSSSSSLSPSHHHRRQTTSTTTSTSKRLVNNQNERRRRITEQTLRMKGELTSDSYPRMIHRFETVFDSQLREFMSRLMMSANEGGHVHLINLYTRLDFNGYVTGSGCRRSRSGGGWNED